MPRPLRQQGSRPRRKSRKWRWSTTSAACGAAAIRAAQAAIPAAPPGSARTGSFQFRCSYVDSKKRLNFRMHHLAVVDDQAFAGDLVGSIDIQLAFLIDE